MRWRLAQKHNMEDNMEAGCRGEYRNVGQRKIRKYEGGWWGVEYRSVVW